VTAAETACEWTPGEFMEAWQENRDDAVEREIDANAVARAVVTMMETCSRYETTAAKLLKELARHAGDDTSLPSWPQQPNRLSGALSRIAAALRQRGITVEHKRNGRQRTIILKRAPETPPAGDDGGDDKGDDKGVDRHQNEIDRHQNGEAEPANGLEPRLSGDDGDDGDGIDDGSPYILLSTQKGREEKRDVEKVSAKPSSPSSQARHAHPTGKDHCQQCGKSLWRTVGDRYRCACGEWWPA
jgi:hypothetical protein